MKHVPIRPSWSVIRRLGVGFCWWDGFAISMCIRHYMHWLFHLIWFGLIDWWMGWLIDRFDLTDWMIDRNDVRLFGWIDLIRIILIYWIIGWFDWIWINLMWLIHWFGLIDGWIDSLIDWWTDWLTDWLIDWLTDWLIDWLNLLSYWFWCDWMT